MPVVRDANGHYHYLPGPFTPGPVGGAPPPAPRTGSTPLAAMFGTEPDPASMPEPAPAPRSMGLRDYLAMGVRGLSGLGSIASAEPGVGTLIGSGLGSAGELAAQYIEGRPELNWTQVGAQGALGAIPFGAFGRVASVPGMMAVGAAHGGLAAGVTESAETGDLPSLGTVGLGAGLGAGGGLIGELIRGGIARMRAPRVPGIPAPDPY